MYSSSQALCLVASAAFQGSARQSMRERLDFSAPPGLHRLLSGSLKAKVMKIPVETKPALWGAAGGAVVLAIVGFSWGGWVTGGRADATATQRANEAVVGALAPICVDRFKHEADLSTNLAGLNKVDSWSRGDFIEKGGWATTPGAASPEQLSAVARACALILAGG